MAIITVVKTIAVKENIFVGLKFDTTLDTQKKMNLLIHKTSTRWADTIIIRIAASASGLCPLAALPH